MSDCKPNIIRRINHLKSFFELGASFIIIFTLLGITPVWALETSDWGIYKKSSDTNPSWDPLVQEGFEALDRQDITGTIEFLKKATNLGCSSPLVYFKLALAYEATGSYYSAVQYYEMARDEFKKFKANHRYKNQFDENYGRALYLSGKKEEALPFLQKVIQNSDIPWILKLLAQNFLEKGDLNQAAQYYERLIKAPNNGLADKNKAEIYLLLARSFLQKKDESSGRHYYEQLLTVDPENSEAKSYLNQKQLTNNQGTSINKALEIFEKH